MGMYCPATRMRNLEWRVFSSVPSCSLIESDPRRCQCPLSEEGVEPSVQS